MPKCISCGPDGVCLYCEACRQRLLDELDERVSRLCVAMDDHLRSMWPAEITEDDLTRLKAIVAELKEL